MGAGHGCSREAPHSGLYRLGAAGAGRCRWQQEEGRGAKEIICKQGRVELGAIDWDNTETSTARHKIAGEGTCHGVQAAAYPAARRARSARRTASGGGVGVLAAAAAAAGGRLCKLARRGVAS